MALPPIDPNLNITGPAYAEAVRDAIEYYYIQFALGGGGATIATGVHYDFYIPEAGTIVEVGALADQTGSLAVALWKDTYANFPPVVGDSIVASAPITITAGVKSRDTTLTGWTTSVSAQDIIRVNVNSATSIQRVSIYLKIRRS